MKNLENITTHVEIAKPTISIKCDKIYLVTVKSCKHKILGTSKFLQQDYLSHILILVLVTDRLHKSRF